MTEKRKTREEKIRLQKRRDKHLASQSRDKTCNASPDDNARIEAIDLANRKARELSSLKYQIRPLSLSIPENVADELRRVQEELISIKQRFAEAGVYFDLPESAGMHHAAFVVGDITKKHESQIGNRTLRVIGIENIEYIFLLDSTGMYVGPTRNDAYSRFHRINAYNKRYDDLEEIALYLDYIGNDGKVLYELFVNKNLSRDFLYCHDFMSIFHEMPDFVRNSDILFSLTTETSPETYDEVIKSIPASRVPKAIVGMGHDEINLLLLDGLAIFSLFNTAVRNYYSSNREEFLRKRKRYGVESSIQHEITHVIEKYVADKVARGRLHTGVWEYNSIMSEFLNPVENITTVSQPINGARDYRLFAKEGKEIKPQEWAATNILADFAALRAPNLRTRADYVRFVQTFGGQERNRSDASELLEKSFRENYRISFGEVADRNLYSEISRALGYQT